MNVLALLLHWLGVAPVPAMTPDEDTVPEENRMPLSPLVRVNWVSENIPLTSVAVNVPAEAVMPQARQVLLQLPA